MQVLSSSKKLKTDKTRKGSAPGAGPPLHPAGSAASPARGSPADILDSGFGRLSLQGAHAGILLAGLLARITCRPRTTPPLPTCFPVQVIRRKSVPDRQTDRQLSPAACCSQRKSTARRTLIRGGRQLREELEFTPVPAQAPGLPGGRSRETTPPCLRETVARGAGAPGYSWQ